MCHLISASVKARGAAIGTSAGARGDRAIRRFRGFFSCDLEIAARVGRVRLVGSRDGARGSRLPRYGGCRGFRRCAGLFGDLELRAVRGAGSGCCFAHSGACGRGAGRQRSRSTSRSAACGGDNTSPATGACSGSKRCRVSRRDRGADTGHGCATLRSCGTFAYTSRRCHIGNIGIGRGGANRGARTTGARAIRTCARRRCETIGCTARFGRTAERVAAAGTAGFPDRAARTARNQQIASGGAAGCASRGRDDAGARHRRAAVGGGRHTRASAPG